MEVCDVVCGACGGAGASQTRGLPAHACVAATVDLSHPHLSRC